MAQKRRRRLENLYNLVKPITKPLLDKKGFLSGSVIQNWPFVIGPAYASQVLPEKVSFPRGSKTGGTLSVSVANSGIALMLGHEKTNILKRLNTYYGYEAISKLHIRQKPHPTPQKRPLTKELPSDKKEEITASTDGIQDDALREALTKLGVSIALHDYNKNEG